MDVLGDIMAMLRTSTHLYGRVELVEPFGLKFPGNKGICIIVLKGSCYLGTDEEPQIQISRGDFVLLPAPAFYTVRSQPKLPLLSAEKIVAADEFRRTRIFSFNGGGTSVASILAGCFTWDSAESRLLIPHLPPMVHLQCSTTQDSVWFRSTLDMIEAEASQERPGGSAIVDRLAEVLFIHALRPRLSGENGSTNSNWLRALSHPQIGEALRRMHKQPDREWTVQELARAAAMSRSAFAEQFRRMVGETPLDHLTRWRMARAANLMRATKPPKMAQIATAVGYESESSFGKAFRRVMGASPGEYRLMARSQ